MLCNAKCAYSNGWQAARVVACHRGAEGPAPSSTVPKTTHEPPLTPGPSPVGRERVARASLEPGEGVPSGRFMDPMRGKSLAINTLHEPPMKILRASHLGMCFGVRDAIALAQREASTRPVTVLGELVHNETVLADLRRRGVRLESEPAKVATDTVIITAHGASERRIAAVREPGRRVVEATCPLVRFAHEQVGALVRAGFHPVIIGRRDHVEVRGLTEDLAVFDVILEEADIAALVPRARFGVAAQTTQPLERVRRLVAALQARFPSAEVRFVDTVCLPTKQRQAAAWEVASESDVVVVIGGAGSNNTRELVATCRKACARVHHVQTAGDLREEWFAGAGTVGITAGTSTPAGIIDGVEAWLRRLAEEERADRPPTPPERRDAELAMASDTDRDPSLATVRVLPFS